MKCSGIVIATVVVILLTSGAAFAQDFPFWEFWHHHEHHGHHPGPAPLLAAGIPAFAALGGGAMLTSLTRRFRRKK